MPNSKEYQKKYYEEHKEVYKNKYNCQIQCETCNKSYSKLNYAKHCKTLKHIQKLTPDIQITPELLRKIIECFNSLS